MPFDEFDDLDFTLESPIFASSILTGHKAIPTQTFLEENSLSKLTPSSAILRHN